MYIGLEIIDKAVGSHIYIQKNLWVSTNIETIHERFANTVEGTPGQDITLNEFHQKILGLRVHL
jgi:hypothetical protein